MKLRAHSPVRIALPRKCPRCGAQLDLRVKPYGSDPDRPWEHAGLAMILRLASDGLTIRAIAEAMRGFKLRRGQRWNPGTVWRILKRQENIENAAKAKNTKA